MESRLTSVSPEAREIVKAIFASRPGVVGLSTQEIHQTAYKMFPGKAAKPRNRTAPEPTDTHPIRSMRYLKRYVLEAMQDENLIAKVYVKAQKGTDENEGTKLILQSKGAPQIHLPAPNLTPGEGVKAWVWRWLSPEEKRARVISRQIVEEAAKARAAEPPKRRQPTERKRPPRPAVLTW